MPVPLTEQQEQAVSRREVSIVLSSGAGCGKTHVLTERYLSHLREGAEVGQIVAITFPAAILQPPFFDPNADPAINYGGIGAVIGHEMSHHFDDQGSKYDAKGNLSDWWTPEDVKNFKTLSENLVKQYDAYEVFPGAHVKGEFTLGENIADLAGLSAAFDAYHASLNGRPAPVIDGLTGDQRFFLAYSQAHRLLAREAALRAQIATNEHAPDPYRAETVRNIDAWYQAFNVQQGQALYLAPADRVRVW